jgi:hypothetical protein
MSKPHLAILAALTAALALPSAVSAQTFEQVFGATNIYGHVGNGALSAAFSEHGEMTVLHWPSPGYYEHLSYLASNAANARELPYLGALPEMGSFAGLAIEHDGLRRTLWLRDAPFTAEMFYASPNSNVLLIVYRADELGIEVTQTIVAHPEHDVLAQRFEVRLGPLAQVDAARLIFYENFSPANAIVPFAPVWNWGGDFLHDFAAVYDVDRRAVLHFNQRYGRLAELSSFMRATPNELPAKVAAFLDDLYAADPRGAYLAIGFADAPDQVQIGFDDSDTCGQVNSLLYNIPWEDLGLPDLGWLVAWADLCVADLNNHIPELFFWRHKPDSAFADAADGELQNSIAAGAEVNAALAKDLVFDDDGRASADVFVGLAGVPTKAMQTLQQARAIGFDELHSQTEAFWQGRLDRASLPASDDVAVTDFARRTLITIFNGMDKELGTIVASIATQTPYYVDWPRDAAFINHALDLAGFHDEVTRHDLFFARVQRKHPINLGRIPAGTYEMNYYANGTPGGPIRFEIDNTGCITWALWDHFAFLQEHDADAARAYLEQVYPAIALAADSLAACRDEATGLQCKANEDDEIEQRNTIQGASAVYMALIAAAEAGTEFGDSAERIQGWQDRAAELAAAAMAYLWNAGEQHFDGPYSGQTWALWPARMLAPGSAEAAGQAASIEAGLQDLLLWQRDRSAYDGKGFLSLAYYFRDIADDAGLERLRGYLSAFLEHVPMKGTLHMGEVYEFLDRDGDGIKESVQHLVSQPHIWEATLNFTASMVAWGAAPPVNPDDDDDDDDNNDNDDNDDDDNDDNDDDSGDDDDDDNDDNNDDHAPSADDDAAAEGESNDEGGCGC